MNSSERIAIEWDCESLCNKWSYLMDQGQFENAVGLFTPDGTFLRNGELLRGHAAILKVYAHRPPVTTMHFTMNFFVIEVSPERVKSRCYMMPVSTFDQSARIKKADPDEAFRFLEFEDEFELTTAGWRFSARAAKPIMQSPSWPGKMPKNPASRPLSTESHTDDGQ